MSSRSSLNSRRFSAIISYVFAAILIVLVVLAAVWTIYYLVFASSGRDINSVVSDTMSALRAEDSTAEEFDVQVRDTEVSDVFSSFPVDDEAYIRPEDIENEWSRMVTMERQATASMKAVSAPVFAKVSEAASAVLPSKKANENEQADDVESVDAAHTAEEGTASAQSTAAENIPDDAGSAAAPSKRTEGARDPLADVIQQSHPLQPAWPKLSTTQERRSA